MMIQLNFRELGSSHSCSHSTSCTWSHCETASEFDGTSLHKGEGGDKDTRWWGYGLWCDVMRCNWTYSSCDSQWETVTELHLNLSLWNHKWLQENLFIKEREVTKILGDEMKSLWIHGWVIKCPSTKEREAMKILDARWWNLKTVGNTQWWWHDTSMVILGPRTPIRPWTLWSLYYLALPHGLYFGQFSSNAWDHSA